METDARDLPMASAISSWVRPYSDAMRLRASAFSIALRSFLWMFSMSAQAAAVLSSISLTMQETSESPALRAALQRRSPAIISNLPSGMLLTTIGCRRPWILMDSLSSSISSAPMSRRGRNAEAS